jgi:hypothetical protein
MDIADAKRGMERFLNSQAMGQKVYYQPWYHVWNIASLANQTTGALPPQQIIFFQNGLGQTGSGFTRPLTSAETSLPVGANGVMPGGVEFIADHLGVDIFPSNPQHLKTFLTQKSFLTQNRLSHNWVCGATRYWPSGEFGHQSAAVSTTVANTTIEYGVNGRVPLRRLPSGAEIYFPAKQQIQFTMQTVETVFLTTDGEPSPAPAGEEGSTILTEALVAVVLLGWQFEVVTT